LLIFNSVSETEMKQNNLSLMRFLTIAFAWFFSMNLSISHAQTNGQKGMVVSSNVIASEIGIEILKKGGNAVDASIATAFALQVTHPTAGNIGGGGFLVFMNAVGMVTTIDFREKAPLTASPNMFLDNKGQLIHESNHESMLAVGAWLTPDNRTSGIINLLAITVSSFAITFHITLLEVSSKAMHILIVWKNCF